MWDDELDPVDAIMGTIAPRQSAPVEAAQPSPGPSSDVADHLLRIVQGQSEGAQMDAARARQYGRQEEDITLLGNVVPFASTAYHFANTNEYTNAKRRVAEGNAQANDYDIVARYEASQHRQAQEDTGTAIVRGLTHVPALAGEALAGGAAVGAIPRLGQAASITSRAAFASPGAAAGAIGRLGATTAAIPSMYLPQAAERAAQQGGDWYSPSNLAPAFLMGAAQTAVLGSLPQAGTYIQGSGIMPTLARLGARTATGMGEQQVVDLLAGGVDNILGEAYQFRTKYGLVGNALRGEWGELGKHAAIQAVTFAAFSALHPVLHGEQVAPQAPGPREPLAIEGPGPRALEGPEQRRNIATIPEPQAGALAEVHPLQPSPLGRRTQEAPIMTTATQRRLLTGPSGETLDAFERAFNELSAIKVGASDKAKAKKGEYASNFLLNIHDTILNGADRSPEAAQKAIDAMKLGKWTKYYADLLVDQLRPRTKPTPLSPEAAKEIFGHLETGEIQQEPVKPSVQVNPLDQFSEPRRANQLRKAAVEPPKQEASLPSLPESQLRAQAVEPTEPIPSHPVATGEAKPVPGDKAGLEASWNDKRSLQKKVEILKQDPRYKNLPFESLERILEYHTPEDAKKYTPQEALERARDLSIGIEANVFGDASMPHHIEGEEAPTLTPPNAQAVAKTGVAEAPVEPEAQRAELQKRMASLTERERYIVEQRTERTLDDIGNELGVGRERVRQIEAEAGEKIGLKKSIAKVNKENAPEAPAVDEVAKHAEALSQIGFTPEEIKDPNVRKAVLRAKAPLDAIEVAQKEVEDITTEMLKAFTKAARKGRQVSNEERTAFDARINEAQQRLNEAIASSEANDPEKLAGQGRSATQEGQALPPGSIGRRSGPAVPTAEPPAQAAQGGTAKPPVGAGKTEGVSGVELGSVEWMRKAFPLQMTDLVGLSTGELNQLKINADKAGRPDLVKILAKYLEKAYELQDSPGSESPVDVVMPTGDVADLGKGFSAVAELLEKWGYARDMRPSDAIDDTRKIISNMPINDLKTALKEMGIDATGSAEQMRDRIVQKFVEKTFAARVMPGEQPPSPEALAKQATDYINEQPKANIANRGRGRPGAINLEPLQDIARFGQSAIDHVSKFLKSLEAERSVVVNRSLGRKAQIDFSFLPGKEEAKKLGNRMLEGWEHFTDEVAQLSGKSFVQMRKFSDALSIAASKSVASKKWTEAALPDLLDAVVGQNVPLKERQLNMSGAMEMQGRHMKEQYENLAEEMRKVGKEEKAKEYQETADTVHSFVGDDGSPFQKEADYQDWLKSTEGKRFVQAWKDNLTDPMHKMYRKYKDMFPEDDLIGPSQMPDMPINRKRLTEQEMADREKELGPHKTGMRPGALENLRAKKLIYDQKAERALPWEAYDMDPINVISKSIADLAQRSTRAEYMREAIKSGAAVRGRASTPGIKLENGDTTWEHPNVWPGESLYVSDKIKGEFRQSLSLDSPLNIPFLTDAAKLLNKVMLTVPIQEGTSHIKNQFTSMFREGVIPFYDHINQIARLWSKDAQTQKEVKADLLRLAEIDATKSAGLESGQFWGGKSDPTSWISNFIDLADKASRLALKTAYERNVQLGRTKFSETGLRDFVNQGLGNYNKDSQHKLVKWLRELGIGPFATAATNFYMQGLRALGIGPGLETTSKAHAVGMRAETILKAAGMLGIAWALNKAIWGNALGDDDTPFGAVKTGKTSDGKTTYADLTAITGLTRGMRQLGLMSLVEGSRQGSSVPRIADRAFDAATSSLLHPAEGPIVSFVHTALSGKNMIGQEVARTPPPSGSHLRENLQAAAIQANPISAALLGQSKVQQDMDWGERALQLLGPYNPFKQRGDQVLSEMHGRLTELNNARQVFNKEPGNLGRAFPQEGERRVLERFNTAVDRLEKAIHGRVKSKTGLRQGAVPEDAEIKRLRGIVSDLARQALQAQERVRR